MNALIERLEKAQGPDRALDGDIALALGINRCPAPGWPNSIDDWVRFDCFHYTRSIDEALKLVPAHHLWEVRQGIEARATVWHLETDYEDHAVPVGHSTTFPAIALCIAALKARAQIAARR